MSTANLYAAVKPFVTRGYDGMETNPLHPNQAWRVVALSFLGMVSAWEEFLESVFVRYLANAKAPGGYTPRHRAGAAVSLDHAYQLVTGRMDYDPDRHSLSWSEPAKVLERADIFFYQGQPFRAAIGHWRQRLRDATRIRNRIAHSSRKAKSDFKKIALEHLGQSSDGKLRQGFAVGDLLLEPADRGFSGLGNQENYLLAYGEMFLDLGGRLVP